MKLPRQFSPAAAFALVVAALGIPSSQSDCVQGNCTDGYGWWEWTNGDRYYGHFKANKRHGLGVYYSESGSKYEGSWERDTKDGHGTWTWSDGTRYTGNWNGDLHHGFGIYLFSGGEMYEGGYDRGKRQGYGINTWPSGDSYEGRFYQDKRKGRGRLSSATGSRYEGDWVDDKIHGLGVWSWVNGNVFDGEWSNGERTGYGRYTWADGSLYKGQWMASKEQGFGLRVQKGLLWGNRTVEGRWANGRLRETSKAPGDFLPSLNKALAKAKRAQQGARETATAAQSSAASAQEAARTAISLARVARFESREKFPAVSANDPRAAFGASTCERFDFAGEVHPALDEFSTGDVVTLSCGDGMFLRGALPLLECGPDGSWLGGPSKSSAIVCQPRPGHTQPQGQENATNTSGAATTSHHYPTGGGGGGGGGGGFDGGDGLSSPAAASTSPSSWGLGGGSGAGTATMTAATGSSSSNTANGGSTAATAAAGRGVNPSGTDYEEGHISDFLAACGLSHLNHAVEALGVRTLDQLLVHTTRQAGLAQVSVRPQNRRRLRACAQDYLLQRHRADAAAGAGPA